MDMPQITVCLNQNRDENTYCLSSETKSQLDRDHGPKGRPRLISIGPSSEDLLPIQRTALMEILTGLPKDEVRKYFVTVIDGDNKPLETWGELADY